MQNIIRIRHLSILHAVFVAVMTGYDGGYRGRIKSVHTTSK